MDKEKHRKVLQKLLKSKIRGRSSIKARYVPKYPIQAERECARVVRGYVRKIRIGLNKNKSLIRKAYMESIDNNSRFDANDDSKLKWAIFLMLADIEKENDPEELERGFQKVGKMAKKKTTEEWKKCVNKTFGVDIYDEYYDELAEESVSQWVSDGSGKAKTAISKASNSILVALLLAAAEGSSFDKAWGSAMSGVDRGFRDAEFIARDGMSSLTADITQKQQQDAGVESYIWNTEHDDLVRECHAELDGKEIKWNDPPEMWYSTKNGIVMTGRHCHPGEDYNCRCMAAPIFNIDNVFLPLDMIMDFLG